MQSNCISVLLCILGLTYMHILRTVKHLWLSRKPEDCRFSAAKWQNAHTHSHISRERKQHKTGREEKEWEEKKGENGGRGKVKCWWLWYSIMYGMWCFNSVMFWQSLWCDLKWVNCKFSVLSCVTFVLSLNVNWWGNCVVGPRSRKRMRGSDTIDIESRLESLITRVGEKVGIKTMAVCIWV